MTAIIKNRFRIKAAKDFLENFVGHPIIPPAGPTSGSHNVDRNHYLGIGRSRPWPTDVVNNVSEISPANPVDTVREDFEFWDGALGFKRVDQGLSCLGVPRFNYDKTGNTIYRPYDDADTNLFAHPTDAEKAAAASAGTYTAGSVYVMTDQFHVFKCLSNNFGIKSTSEPTLSLSAPYIVTGADGYRWKYMGTVTPAQSLYFLSDQWMPVKTLGAISDDGSSQWDVEQNAVDGSIDSYITDNVGSGYTNIHSGTFASGSTAGVTAVLQVGASASDNAYNNGTVFITAGTGSGLVRKITGYTGTSPARTITVDTSWTVDATSVYEIWPTLVITGNTTGAVAKVKVGTSGPTLGKITDVVVITNGTGYTYASGQVLAPGGVGTGAIVRPILSPKGGHGKNIENELGAWFAIVTVRLAYNDGAGDLPNSNDYRQIVLIRDLKNADGSLAYDATRIGVKSLLLQGVVAGVGGLFQPDETITGVSGGTTAVAKVVEYVASVTPGEGTLYFWQDSGTGFVGFLQAMSITSDQSFATATVKTSGVVAAEVQKNSGDIIYLENRRPILRAPDQTEDIKVVVEF